MKRKGGLARRWPTGRSSIFRIAAAGLLAVLFPATLPAAGEPAGPTYGTLAPILAQRCILCHSGEGAPLGLRLDSYENLLKGSANGPVVKQGDPAGSELIRRIKGISNPRMPLTGPPYLADGEIALFEQWVQGGLPEGEPPAVPPPAPEAALRPAPGEPVTYAHVAAIFAKRCVKCHRDGGLMGRPPEGFRLNSYQATLASGERARVVPGNPGASELVRRIKGQARPRMPFDGPPYLSDEEIGLIEAWIADGARNAEGTAAPVPAGARVRLHGTLQGGWMLDDLPLAVGGRTRIDKSPRPGDYVEVRGRIDDGGRVQVERLRRR